MAWYPRVFRRRRDSRADLDREIAFHLAEETRLRAERGQSPGRARVEARRAFGNAMRVREQVDQLNPIGTVDEIWRDLKYGARLLQRNRGFAIVAILSLALGIGANTSIFQLLDAVRLRTLPVKDPGQLAEVRVANATDGRSGSFTGQRPELTNPLWEHIRAEQQGFSRIFAWGATSFEMASGGESQRAQGLWVGGDFFGTLEIDLFSAACSRPPMTCEVAEHQARLSATHSGSGAMAVTLRWWDEAFASTGRSFQSSASRRPALSGSTSAAASTSPCRFAPSG